jgi:hypothetical protein
VVNHRRKKRLTILAGIIVFLTFLFGRVLTDRLKESVDSLSGAANEYERQLGTGTLSTQIANLQLEVIAARKKGMLSGDSKGKDYSLIVMEDLGGLEQRRSQLNLDMEDMSRLLDTLPAGPKDLRTMREGAKAFVDKTNLSLDELKKPGQTNDWNRAVRVKLGIIPVALAQIYVAVVGDSVLTRVKQVRDARKKVYQFCLWADYFFYVLGFGLGLYAQLSGLGSLPGTE